MIGQPQSHKSVPKILATGTKLCLKYRMDLKTLISRLQVDDLSKVSTATGVPYETLRRISTGMTPGPRITTVERIADYYASPKRRDRAAA